MNPADPPLPRPSLRRRLEWSKYLYLLFAGPFPFYVLFEYTPMYGVLIAFKEIKVFRGLIPMLACIAGRAIRCRRVSLDNVMAEGAHGQAADANWHHDGADLIATLKERQPAGIP